MDGLTLFRGPALCLTILFSLLAAAIPAEAQTQSHPLSQISPIDTNLDLNSRNITSLNYLLYTGGIFYSGSQGIPSADIATSAVTGAKIASGVITSSKLSNPIGGSLNASAYYDSDNSGYFLDPASLSDALLVAGDVGIGTTSPTTKLQVTDASSDQQLRITDTGTLTIDQGRLEIGYGASGEYGRLQVWKDDFGALPILLSPAGGNVGIGNIDPQAKLHVGAGSDAPGVGQTNLIVTNAGGTSFAVRDSANDIEAFIHSGTSGINIGSFTNHAINLVTGNIIKLTVASDGNVGIGTTNPANKLNVVGDLNVTGTIYGSINTTGDVSCTECVDTSDFSRPPIKVRNSETVGFVKFGRP